ncbi:MAG TPA: acetylglutamate kinase [Bryobacteraceae bacterium]|nr:acetylglutamate kinase [Bryobacteraceae bacterium]
MKVLIKLGGTLLDSVESRNRLSAEISALRARNLEVVVVHGGGKQMTRFLSERGIESRFVGGLRVSTPEVIDAVLKVLAGTVNHELVASLVAAGSKAVGLSGIDASLTEAEQLHADLGAVGRPVRSETALLDLLTSNGYLPVVACVAGDKQGQIFNVNADQMAVACAIGYRADKLIFLTDVDGVKGKDGNILPSLTPAGCEQLIAEGIATGGMQAKLNAATDALKNGIAQVIIAPGSLQKAAERILAGEQIGTKLAAEEGVRA